MTRLTNRLIYPFKPLVSTLRHYTLGTLGRDALAGLTVAVVEVPQAMAYALIAGVPAQYGLYASIVQGLIAAMFSSSRHSATGPTNTQSLLIAAAVTRAMQQMGYGQDPVIYVQLAVGLTLVKALIQLAFAAGGLGHLVRYVSQSVIVGFAAGAGVLIAVGQLPTFLGLPPLDPAASSLPGVPGQWLRMAPHLSQISSLSVMVGSLVLAVVLGVRLFSRLIPGPLLGMMFAAALVYLAGWGPSDLRLVGDLPRELPSFSVPRIGLKEAELLIAGALALALLGMIETVSIAKSLATRTGQRIDPNREFLAQGLANLVGSFFQAIPGSGSFTRSALNYEAGGRTQVSGMLGAGFVAAIFLLLGPQARYIPLTSLSAILFVIAWGLIDWRYIVRVVRTSRVDAMVCLATFAATLVAPLQYAIYIGVFLNIALYLRHASQLHVSEMVRTQAGPFVERPIQNRSGERKVIFLQLEGDLFFGVADELQDRLTEIASTGVKVIILRLKRTRWIDSTVLHVLERFTRDYQAREGHMILCGVRPGLIDTLRKFGLLDLIGPRNVFEAEFGVFTSAKRALQRARELVGSSIDLDNVADMADENESWAYQI